MRQPSYVGGILRGLDCYREFLQGAPSIVIGDFNSPGNDARSRSHHAALEDRLLTEFALMNAWRVYAERTGQPIDEPTYYLQRQNDRPFHIDYCFFPEAWASTLRSVEIGNYSDWATDSDHRPILVEFE